jgi:hypothetical protein
VLKKWPRVGNGLGSKTRNNSSSLVEKNGEYILLLRADILSDLTNVSERMDQMIIIDVIY